MTGANTKWRAPTAVVEAMFWAFLPITQQLLDTMPSLFPFAHDFCFKVAILSRGKLKNMGFCRIVAEAMLLLQFWRRRNNPPRSVEGFSGNKWSNQSIYEGSSAAEALFRREFSVMSGKLYGKATRLPVRGDACYDLRGPDMGNNCEGASIEHI